jgi:hypothetical protein
MPVRRERTAWKERLEFGDERVELAYKLGNLFDWSW